MKTLKILALETLLIGLSFAGIVYAVFAASFIVGVVAAGAFVLQIVIGLKKNA